MWTIEVDYVNPETGEVNTVTYLLDLENIYSTKEECYGAAVRTAYHRRGNRGDIETIRFISE